MKKRLLFVCALFCMITSISACNPFNKEGSQEQISENNNVDFEIEDNQNPDFSTNVSDIETDISSIDQPLYEEDGEYAYELDPNTMERISGPLDPVTYEPIDNEVAEDPVMNNSVSNEQIGDQSVNSQTSNPLAPDVQPSEQQQEIQDTDSVSGTVPPDDYNKLPNTGLYPEE